jgi:hypothetical protein
MEKECPYCSARVEITRMVEHVQLAEDNDHDDLGSVPERDLDNPWNLRVSFDDDATDDYQRRVIEADVIKDHVRRGRCPACEFGVMGLKGGDGFLTSGRRRLACPSCGWETPEWVSVD